MFVSLFLKLCAQVSSLNLMNLSAFMLLINWDRKCLSHEEMGLLFKCQTISAFLILVYQQSTRTAQSELLFSTTHLIRGRASFISQLEEREKM
jgi:hypothetical protein